MTTFTILDPKTCGRKIDRIAKVGRALQTEIHSVAVSTLAHIREHGDYTLAIRLLNAMPNGQRVNALGFWYGHFSDGVFKVSFDKDSASWVGKLKGDRDQIDVEGAANTSYADLVPEKKYTTFTVEAFASMLKRKANEDGLNPDGTPKVDPKLRGVLADLYVKVKGAIDGNRPVVAAVELDELMPEQA
jgi:hypothetical protein